MQPEDFPIQNPKNREGSSSDGNDDFCSICLNGGDEVLMCCDKCPRVFHYSCYMPKIEVAPNKDVPWFCTYCISKPTIDEMIAELANEEGSEKFPLVAANQRQFSLACKFLSEVYRLPESPTLRWGFPQGYKVSKVLKQTFKLTNNKVKVYKGSLTHLRIPLMFVNSIWWAVEKFHSI